MSPVIKKTILLFSAGLLTFAFACSSPNSQSNFNPDTGQHAANWLPAGHKAAASADATTCTQCHGTDLLGGISKVSCTSCHLGGPTMVHPADWNPIYSSHGAYVNTAATGTEACANQYCHGTSLTGVPDSGPSCDKRYGIGGCHNLPFDPNTVTCGACHRIPPNGTTAPNIAGSHGVHTAITGTLQATCDACHSGASAYIGSHSNGTVDVSIANSPGAYMPKTGATPTYNTSMHTCSNISCHGGQTTPDWLTGTLDVNTQCTSCHAYGTSQYNSFSSGKHDLHVNQKNIACTECHDTSLLAVNHFTTLNTTAMEGPASQTIKSTIDYRGGTCYNPCHGRQNW